MMLHISPSKKHPNQPSFGMDPHYLNFPSGSQALGDGYTQAVQSVGQDSRLYFSLHESTSQYLPTVSPQSYPLLYHDGHGSLSASRMPQTNFAQSFRPPMGSGFIKTVSSLSSHPNHHADHASVSHQGWGQPPFSAVPAFSPASGTAIPSNVIIGNRASACSHDSSQLCLAARGFAPAPPFGSPLQANIVDPDTNQNMSSLMGSFTVPGHASPSTHRTPASPPYTPADPADIEYAQYRYGNKRCFYRCRFDISGSPCNTWIVGDRTRVLRHLRNHHRLKTGPAAPAFCCWDKCTHPRPMKQENLSRHIVMHLGVKWKCPHCSRLFSRDDAVHRHMERMAPGMDVTEAQVVPGREACTITDPQFKRARTA